MIGFNYLAKKALAERLLERYGKTAILTQPGAPTGPLWDRTPGAPVDTPVFCVEMRGTISNQMPSVASKGERRLLISTSAGVTPLKGSKILVDGVTHTLGKVSAVNLGGTVLMFDAEIET